MTLPNFILIGAAKSGTSSLYYYLKQHPQVYMPASRDQKEPDFFTLEGKSREQLGPFGKFTMHNAITDLASYEALFEGVQDELAIGEASTSYLYSEKAAHRIHHYIPDAKIIAILRDPAERAFSHFLFSLSNGREPNHNFAQTLKEEDRRVAEGWSFQWHHKRRGFYFKQLQPYYQLFGSEQIRVYLYEDLINQPIGLTKKIFEFLKVDDTFSPDTTKKHNPTAVPKNQTLNTLLNRPNLLKDTIKHFIPKSFRQIISEPLKKQNLGKPELSKEVRKQLIAEYREDILKLQELIDRDLSNWLKN
jgi:hypothetical protein